MTIPGYFEYGCRTRIVAGLGSLEKIPRLFSEAGAGRPLLVTDRGVAKAGLADTVLGAMGGECRPAAVEDDVPPDSELEAVRRIAAVYRDRRCDGILAVGGGSVLDTAKGVNVLVSEHADDLRRFAGAEALSRPLSPLIAVPTTAGTGSEVTLVAVVADRRAATKMLLTSPFLQPMAAVIDPRMTVTLPPTVTAATGMDALAHAVEAYTCLGKNPVSDACARAAVALIGAHLLPAIREPENEQGRLSLAVAATLAGMAFSNAMVGMVHSLGHAVGAICHVPHGNCMAILLPYGLEFNQDAVDAHTAELLLPLAGEEAFVRTPAHHRGGKTISFIRMLNQTLHEWTDGGHPRHFSEVYDGEGAPRVPREELPSIARKAIDDASVFYNPKAMDYNDALRVLEAAWEGRPLDAG
jgi:alcohol dehydrogenase